MPPEDLTSSSPVAPQDDASFLTSATPPPEQAPVFAESIAIDQTLQQPSREDRINVDEEKNKRQFLENERKRMKEVDLLSKILPDTKGQTKEMAGIQTQANALIDPKLYSDMTVNWRATAALLGKPLDELDATKYGDYKSEIAVMLNRPAPKSESEYRSMLSEHFVKEKNKDAALNELYGNAVLKAVQDVSVDLPTNYVQEWKTKHQDLIDGDAAYHAQANRVYLKTARDIAPIRKEIGATLQALNNFTTGKADDAEMKNLGRMFKDMPAEQMDKILSYVSVASKTEKLDPKNAKGFLQQLGESISRSVDFAGDMQSQPELVAMDKIQKDINAGKEIYLRNDQFIRGKADNDFNRAVEAYLFNNRERGQFKEGKEFKKATPEQVAALKSQIEESIKIAKVSTKLKQFAQTAVDPISPIAADGTWAQTFEQMAYDVGSSVGPMAATGLNPFLGFEAYHTMHFNDLLVKNPDKDLQTINVTAGVEGALESFGDLFQIKMLKGAMPPVIDNYIKKLGSKNARAFMRVAEGFLGEYAIETLQDAIPAAVEGSAVGMGVDLNPTATWDDFSVFDARRFWAMAFMGGVGAGVATFKDLKDPTKQLNREIMGYNGVHGAKAEYVLAAESPEEADARWREVYNERTPEDIARGEALLEKDSQEAESQKRGRDSYIVAKRPDGTSEWIVRDPAGKEVARVSSEAEAATIIADRGEAEIRSQANVVADLLDSDWRKDKLPNFEARFGGEVSPEVLIKEAEAKGDTKLVESIKASIEAHGADPAELSKLRILGESWVTPYGEGQYKAFVKLNEGHTALDAFEELAHNIFDIDVAEGRITKEQAREWVSQAAAAGVANYKFGTDAEVRESMAQIAQDFAHNKLDQTTLPSSFVAFLKKLYTEFVEFMRRAKLLDQAFKDGKIDAEFERYLMGKVGLSDASMIEREVNRIEGETGGGFSINEKPDPEVVEKSNDTTEQGTPAPDTKVEELNPEDGETIPWTDSSYSIRHLPEVFPEMSQEIFDQIASETKTIAAIHIDRMKVGEFAGIPLQGGMFYPAIVENLKKGVAWAFNAPNVARSVARRAAANGGYVKLVLMQEGNVIGNKTFGNIWFKQLQEAIDSKKVSKTAALKELNRVRDLYSKTTGHSKAWKSIDEAKEAILAMPQQKRASTYFQKTQTETKSEGVKIAYQSLLAQKMTKAGFPDAKDIVANIEEPSFKGVPKGATVGIIKFDPHPEDAPILTAEQAGVPEHLSYGYVLKGKPVARLTKYKVVDEAFPETKNQILTQQHTDFPLENSVSFSIRARDEAYDAAVKAGDEAEMQRLVDEAAKEAGYTVGPVYHGTSEPITEFDKGKFGSVTNTNRAKKGVFFTSDNNFASEFANNAAWRRGKKEGGHIVSSYLKLENPLSVDLSKERDGHHAMEVAIQKAEKDGNDGVYFKNAPDTLHSQRVIKINGKTLSLFDGVGISEMIEGIEDGTTTIADAVRAIREEEVFARSENEQTAADSLKSLADALESDPSLVSTGHSQTTDVHFVFDPSQIKSADPITRDDAGNVIPLSQRFNPESNDIRYSIQSQEQIDRVNKAVADTTQFAEGRMALYEKAKKRFKAVIAENKEILDALKEGGAAPEKIRRQKLIQAIAELEVILRQLPAEVRGKVGGFGVLARGGTGDTFLANFFKDRVRMIDEQLEKYLSKEYDEELYRIFERAKPKKNLPGEKPKGIGAEIQALFAELKEAKNWSPEKLEGEIAKLETELDQVERSEAHGWDEIQAKAKEEARILQTINLLSKVGAWNPKYAQKTKADGSSSFVKIYNGKSSNERADAIRALKAAWAKGFYEFQMQKIKEREEREALQSSMQDATDKAGTDAERIQKQLSEMGMKDGWGKSIYDLSSFDQVVNLIFGDNSQIANELSDVQRKAENQKEDNLQRKYEEVENLFTELAGGRLKGKQLQYDMMQPSIKFGEGRYKGIELSQMAAISDIMMWNQEDGRRHMEGRYDDVGNPISKWHYTQDFIDYLEKNLTPEARAVMDFLLQKYAEEHPEINKVYKPLNGIDLVNIENYAPLSVTPQQQKSGQMVDPTTGQSFSSASITPRSLLTRGASIAQPNITVDAVQKYLAHTRQMEHWKAFAPVMAKYGMALRNRDVLDSIEAKAGKAGRTAITNWLDFMTMGGVREAGASLWTNKMANDVMGRAAQIALFGRAGTILLQGTQLAAASAVMPHKAYLVRLSKLLTGNLGWKDAIKSDYIQRRIKQMPVVEQQAMQELATARPSRVIEIQRTLGASLSAADGLFTGGTFAMVYDYQLSQAKENGMTGKEAEDFALNEAERITDRIAQPTRPGARSMWELTATSPAARLAFSFASEPRKNIALLWYAKRTDGLVSARFWRAFTYTVILSGILSALARNAWKDAKDDSDDEWLDDKHWGWKRLLLMAVTDPANGIPLVGSSMQEGALKLFGVYYQNDNLISLNKAASTARQLPKYWEGDWTSDQVTRDVDSILSVMGMANQNIAAYASLSHLLTDAFGVAKNTKKAATGE